MPAAALPLVAGFDADLDFGFAAAASSFLSASGFVSSAGFGLAASFFRADFGFASGFLAAGFASCTGTGLARGSPCASAVELPKITAKIAAETRIRTSTPGAAP